MDGFIKKPDFWESTSKVNKNNKDLLLGNNTDNYIVVLAGGIDNNGNVNKWVENRLKLCIDEYKTNKYNKIICLGGGSYHKKPVTNSKGYIIHESTSCAEFLIENGISPTKIIKEWGSYDTIANGYFLFSNFIKQLNIKKIKVITSEFHIDRTKLIFNYMNNVFNYNIEIEYDFTKDTNVEVYIIESRKKREIKSYKSIKNILNYLDTLKKFTEWFYCEHKAYCSNAEIIRNIDISHNELRSY